MSMTCHAGGVGLHEENLVVSTDADDIVCIESLRNYMYTYRPSIIFITSCLIPTCTVLLCNWAIIRILCRDLMQTTMRDSIVRLTTVVCLVVSGAFIFCALPNHVFLLTLPNWPITLQNQYNTLSSQALLRYANHAVNFFLYNMTGVHFRLVELVALFRSFGHTTAT